MALANRLVRLSFVSHLRRGIILPLSSLMFSIFIDDTLDPKADHTGHYSERKQTMRHCEDSRCGAPQSRMAERRMKPSMEETQPRGFF
jgi:hypothetical protein